MMWWSHCQAVVMISPFTLCVGEFKNMPDGGLGRMFETRAKGGQTYLKINLGSAGMKRWS
jgi:hypothetical protein